MKNRKKKNGFTLVELLVTVGILSLVLSVTGYVLFQIIDDSEKKVVQVVDENVGEAARLYVTEYFSDVVWTKDEENDDIEQSCILVDDLVNKGYLSDSDVKNADLDLRESILLTRDSNHVILSEEKNSDVCPSVGEKVDIPKSEKLCNDLKYTGSNQELAKSVDSRISFENNTGKNAGEYKVKVKLKSGNVWKDNTSSDKEIVCTTDTAVPELNILPNDVIDPSEYQAGEFVVKEVDTNINGEVSVKNSNSEFTNVSVVTSGTTASGNGKINIELLATRDAKSYLTIILTPTGTDKNNYYSNSKVIKVEKINRNNIAIPTSSYCKNLTYTGSNQTLVNSPGVGYEFINTTGTNAGTYTVTAKIKYGYKWSDGSFTDKTFNCSINKANPKITLSPNSGTVFVGETTTAKFTPVVDGNIVVSSDNTSYVTVSTSTTSLSKNSSATISIKGVKAISSVKAKVTFNSKDTTNYNSVSTTYTLKVVNKATIPTAASYCKSGLIYNGRSQTLTNAAGSGYSFSNNKKTNAGTYTVSAILSSGYMWSDRTSEPKTIICKINKKTPTVTLSETSGTVMKTKTRTTEATPSVYGTITAASTNTNYVKVSSVSPSSASYSGPAIINLEGVEVTNGIGVTITLSPNDTTNYNTKSVTYRLEVTTNQFTLTYDSNGGKDCVPKFKIITNGSTYGELCIPTRTGYDFIGWYSSTYDSEPLNYYADYHTDLKEKYGYNTNSLYKHYLDSGKSNGFRISQYVSTDIVTTTSNMTIYAGWVKIWYMRRTRTWYDCLYTECVGGYVYPSSCPDRCFSGFNRATCIREGIGIYFKNGKCCGPVSSCPYWSSCKTTQCVSGWGSWSSWSGYDYASCSGSNSVQCSGAYFDY